MIFSFFVCLIKQLVFDVTMSYFDEFCSLFILFEE